MQWATNGKPYFGYPRESRENYFLQWALQLHCLNPLVMHWPAPQCHLLAFLGCNDSTLTDELPSRFLSHSQQHFKLTPSTKRLLGWRFVGVRPLLLYSLLSLCITAQLHLGDACISFSRWHVRVLCLGSCENLTTIGKFQWKTFSIFFYLKKKKRKTQFNI